MPVRTHRQAATTTPAARIEALERDLRKLRSDAGAARKHASVEAGTAHVLSWATLGMAVLAVLMSLLALVRR